MRNYASSKLSKRRTLSSLGSVHTCGQLALVLCLAQAHNAHASNWLSSVASMHPLKEAVDALLTESNITPSFLMKDRLNAKSSILAKNKMHTNTIEELPARAKFISSSTNPEFLFLNSKAEVTTTPFYLSYQDIHLIKAALSPVASYFFNKAHNAFVYLTQDQTAEEKAEEFSEKEKTAPQQEDVIPEFGDESTDPQQNDVPEFGDESSSPEQDGEPEFDDEHTAPHYIPTLEPTAKPNKSLSYRDAITGFNWNTYNFNQTCPISDTETEAYRPDIQSQESKALIPHPYLFYEIVNISTTAFDSSNSSTHYIFKESGELGRSHVASAKRVYEISNAARDPADYATQFLRSEGYTKLILHLNTNIHHNIADQALGFTSEGSTAAFDSLNSGTHYIKLAFYLNTNIHHNLACPAPEFTSKASTALVIHPNFFYEIVNISTTAFDSSNSSTHYINPILNLNNNIHHNIADQALGFTSEGSTALVTRPNSLYEVVNIPTTAFDLSFSNFNQAQQTPVASGTRSVFDFGNWPSLQDRITNAKNHLSGKKNLNNELINKSILIFNNFNQQVKEHVYGEKNSNDELIKWTAQFLDSLSEWGTQFIDSLSEWGTQFFD